MSDDKRDMSRRRFLEGTGATLGVLSVGAGCSDAGEATGPQGAAGQSSTSGGQGGQPTGGQPTGGSAPAAGSGTGGAPVSSGGTGAGTGAAGTEAGGGSGGSPAVDAGAEPQADAGDSTGDSGMGPMASGVLVGIVKQDDIDAAVARAVELAGGIDEIQPGQTVFIKPNAVSDRAIGSPGIRTHLDVLSAVIRLVKEKDPGHIIVGDRSARTFDTDDVFVNAGFTEAAMAAGADEVYPAPSETASPDDWMLVQPPYYEEVWAGAGGVWVMRKIVEADHLINVPTCKNHQFALFSLALKNFVGAIGDSSRDPLHYLSSIGANFEPLSRDIALLNQPFSPLINILDALSVLLNGGPGGDGNDAVRSAPGWIMASKDRVALDTAAVSLIKHELSSATVASPDASQSLLASTSPWEFPQIVHAIDLGLGLASASEGSLLFEGVEQEAASAVEAIWRE